MKILALESSAKAASVCVAEDGRIIGESFINASLTHSQTLVPMVEQVCKNAMVPLDEIEAVAVNAGPGSFTGVRIGVAAAKGLAFSKSLKCVPVSTLESMAYNALGNSCIVCALMDARCSQVYNAMFRVSGEMVERLCEDRAFSLSELKTELEKYRDENVVLIGDGAQIGYDHMKDCFKNISLAPENLRYQRASSTALAAFELIKQGKTVSDSELMPVYLRLPQAQRELNKRMGATV